MKHGRHPGALRGQRRKRFAAQVALRFVQDRLSVQELAVQVGCRPVVVRRLLDEAGIYDAGRTLVGSDERETTRKLVRAYERAGSISALVRQTGMDKRVIRHVLLGAGVSLRVRHSLTPDEVDQVVARYRAGESIRALAASIGSSYGTIRTALQAAHVELRRRGGAVPTSAHGTAGGQNSTLATVSVTTSDTRVENRAQSTRTANQTKPTRTARTTNHHAVSANASGVRPSNALADSDES